MLNGVPGLKKMLCSSRALRVDASDWVVSPGEINVQQLIAPSKYLSKS